MSYFTRGISFTGPFSKSGSFSFTCHIVNCTSEKADGPRLLESPAALNQLNTVSNKWATGPLVTVVLSDDCTVFQVVGKPGDVRQLRFEAQRGKEATSNMSLLS